jgi:hypothetical protein
MTEILRQKRNGGDGSRLWMDTIAMGIGYQARRVKFELHK